MNSYNRKLNYKPDVIDVASSVLIYEGWIFGTGYRIRKTVIAGAIITRTWADGAWASRTQLSYS